VLWHFEVQKSKSFTTDFTDVTDCTDKPWATEKSKNKNKKIRETRAPSVESVVEILLLMLRFGEISIDTSNNSAQYLGVAVWAPR